MPLDTTPNQVFEGLFVALFRLQKAVRSLLIQLLVPPPMRGDFVARVIEASNHVGIFLGDRTKNEESGPASRFVQQPQERIEPSTKASLLALPALARELDPVEPLFEIHRKRVGHRESLVIVHLRVVRRMTTTSAWKKGISPSSKALRRGRDKRVGPRQTRQLADS